MLRRFASSEIVRFLLVGGCAAGANFFSRILFSLWLPYALAILASFLVGLTLAFVLNRKYVFAHAANQHWWGQFVRFLSVNLAALLQTLLISLALADYLLPLLDVRWHAAEIAHAIGVATPLFTSYLAHRHWSFKRAPTAQPMDKAHS